MTPPPPTRFRPPPLATRDPTRASRRDRYPTKKPDRSRALSRRRAGRRSPPPASPRFRTFPPSPRKERFDPQLPFSSIDSNAGPCPDPVIGRR